jgi:energy-coupling factor transporter ATP-binding protein EcfA2
VQPTTELVARIEELRQLAERRWALLADESPPADEGPAAATGARDRGRELVQHLTRYLLPRARDLDAPLVVLILGPTGSGKSTLLNTIAGAAVSPTGILRPTTRSAVILATRADATRLLDGGALAGLPPGRAVVRSEGARSGMAVIDSPDIDSVEHDNRALADVLLEAADLCAFVTTAVRYADRVPWAVLRRAEQRGLPIVVVADRLPTGAEATRITDDIRRLLSATVLRGPDPEPSGGGAVPARPTPAIIAVTEGALDATGAALQRAAIAPLLDRLDALAADRAARRALAAASLAAAVRGVAPLCAAVADDLEHEALDADALRRVAAADHDEERRLLLDRLERGTVLREEVVRQWHTFVGADQVTRWFAGGIGRLRAAVGSLVRHAPTAPVAAVTHGAAEDLAALVVAHAGDAARRTATHWSADARGGPIVAAHPELWSPSADLADRTRDALEDWVRTISADVADTGATKKGVARALSLGVNAGAVTIMLSVFAHTGGVTGAEVGIAAATAFLNQKLMNAVFGEAAMIELVDRARAGLRDRIAGLMAEERGRFDALVHDGAELRALGQELRSAAISPDAAVPPTPRDEAA